MSREGREVSEAGVATGVCVCVGGGGVGGWVGGGKVATTTKTENESEMFSTLAHYSYICTIYIFG